MLSLLPTVQQSRTVFRMTLVRPSVKSSSSSNLLAPALRALAGADIWPAKIAKLRSVSVRPKTSSETTHFPDILISPNSLVADGRTLTKALGPALVPLRTLQASIWEEKIATGGGRKRPPNT